MGKGRGRRFLVVLGHLSLAHKRGQSGNFRFSRGCFQSTKSQRGHQDCSGRAEERQAWLGLGSSFSQLPYPKGQSAIHPDMSPLAVTTATVPVSPVQALITLPWCQELQRTHFSSPNFLSPRPTLRYGADPLSLNENPRPTGQSPTPTEHARPLPARVPESHRSRRTLTLTLCWLHGRTRVQGPTSPGAHRGQHDQPELLGG